MTHLPSRATAALALLFVVSTDGLGQTTSRTVVLTHANIVDGVRGAYATNATVVIRDGKIADIVTGPFSPPTDAQVIDVGGRYVLPGLIDCHTHIASLANANSLTWRLSGVRSSRE